MFSQRALGSPRSEITSPAASNVPPHEPGALWETTPTVVIYRGGFKGWVHAWRLTRTGPKTKANERRGRRARSVAVRATPSAATLFTTAALSRPVPTVWVLSTLRIALHPAHRAHLGEALDAKTRRSPHSAPSCLWTPFVLPRFPPLKSRRVCVVFCPLRENGTDSPLS